MSRLQESYDPDSSGERAGPALAMEEATDPLLEVPGDQHTVLVTGARGFLGVELLPRLLHRGHRIRAVVRRLPPPGHELRDRVDWWQADLTRPEELAGIAEDCDRVVHLAGSAPPGAERRGYAEVDVEGTRHLADEAERSGVTRFVYVSSLGAAPDAGDFYERKHRAEHEVLDRHFEALVLRPAVIYGPGDYLTTRLRRAAREGRWLPVPGDGEFALQPVAVEDVVEALCQGVERPGFEERIYELGGPRPLPFAEIVRAVGNAVGRRLRVLSLPTPVALPARKVLGGLGGGEGLTPGEVEWLRGQGILTDEEHALRTVFRLEPLPFREVLGDYL